MVHYASRSHGKYNVEDMFTVSKDFPIFKIPLSTLKYELKIKVWSTGSGKPVSPWEILTEEVVDDSHMKRILNADLSYPILVMDEMINWKHSKVGTIAPGEMKEPVKWDVLDGYHRIAKAYLIKRRELPAKEFSWANLQKTKITNKKIDTTLHKSSKQNSVRTSQGAEILPGMTGVEAGRRLKSIGQAMDNLRNARKDKPETILA
jgi:hypothetical protein